MGNALKKREIKLKIRQDQFDSMRTNNKDAYKRPGSMNLHKQHGSSKGAHRY